MYPKAYIDFLIHFHADRDYFECHEILEEHWKQAEPSKRKQVWVALIQIAVSLYHHRRGNWKGAERMLRKAISLVRQEQKAIENLGLNYTELICLLEKRETEIKEQLPYTSMDLPIKDARLLETCQTICREHHLSWGKESDLTNEFLLHKHKLRDRSDVIAEREKQKILRKKNKRDA